MADVDWTQINWTAAIWDAFFGASEALAERYAALSVAESLAESAARTAPVVGAVFAGKDAAEAYSQQYEQARAAGVPEETAAIQAEVAASNSGLASLAGYTAGVLSAPELTPVGGFAFDVAVGGVTQALLNEYNDPNRAGWAPAPASLPELAEAFGLPASIGPSSAGYEPGYGQMAAEFAAVGSIKGNPFLGDPNVVASAAGVTFDPTYLTSGASPLSYGVVTPDAFDPNVVSYGVQNGTTFGGANAFSTPIDQPVYQSGGFVPNSFDTRAFGGLPPSVNPDGAPPVSTTNIPGVTSPGSITSYSVGAFDGSNQWNWLGDTLKAGDAFLRTVQFEQPGQDGAGTPKALEPAAKDAQAALAYLGDKDLSPAQQAIEDALRPGGRLDTAGSNPVQADQTVQPDQGGPRPDGMYDDDSFEGRSYDGGLKITLLGTLGRTLSRLRTPARDSQRHVCTIGSNPKTNGEFKRPLQRRRRVSILCRHDNGRMVIPACSCR